MNKSKSARVSLHQICYSEETLLETPEGMEAIDNLSNPRPDWREYWPIRKFLLNTKLENGVLYGFFSPKFNYKTGLTPESVREFVDSKYSGESVVSFSPYWDMCSYFVNVIEQGDSFHAGLKDAAIGFLSETGRDPALANKVMHSGNTIYCNYLIADKDFWMTWLNWCEQLFEIAEDTCVSNLLGAKLRYDTTYGQMRVPLKVFLMERMASLILSDDPDIRCLPYDTFSLPSGAVGLQSYKTEAVCCDSLKRSYIQTGWSEAIKAFFQTRTQVLESIVHSKQLT